MNKGLTQNAVKHFSTDVNSKYKGSFKFQWVQYLVQMVLVCKDLRQLVVESAIEERRAF